ncbi:MAG: lipoyl synthase [Desulfobacterales bacterium]
MTAENSTRIRKPAWLRQKLPVGAAYEHVRAMLKENRLHTVCQEAKCPNMWQCFSRRTSTFLILGPRCTRNCRFCSVEHGMPVPPDPAEPARVADAVKNMGLEYAVITSVTRDDLPDGGAQFFAQTVHEIHKALPDAQVEVLIPDFQGNADALQTVLDSGVAVLNHNLETVPRLYPSVRPEAIYRRSLDLLSQAKKYNAAIAAKSGLMLGLGETSDEIRRTLEDLRNSSCDLLTLGQYLQPSASHLPVERFVHPDEFESWRKTALEMGFAGVASGPFVRSSYHAKELFCAIAF